MTRGWLATVLWKNRYRPSVRWTVMVLWRMAYHSYRFLEDYRVPR